MDYISHDLKSERREVSPGLPSGLKAIPVLFYLGTIACILSSVWFYLQLKSAREDISFWSSEATRIQADNTRLASERKGVQNLNERAQSVSDWVTGSVGVQPLAVAIARSMGEEATIAELELERNEDIPSQIHMTLKMDGATAPILDRTLESVRNLNFRPYGASQVKDEDALDYKATLVWQNYAARSNGG